MIRVLPSKPTREGLNHANRYNHHFTIMPASVGLGGIMDTKPILVDQFDDPRLPCFHKIEVFNDGYDVSVTTPHGDTVNIFIDSDGFTHVVMQASNNRRFEAKL